MSYTAKSSNKQCSSSSRVTATRNSAPTKLSKTFEKMKATGALTEVSLQKLSSNASKIVLFQRGNV